MGPKAVEAVPALINVVLEKTPDYRSGEGDCLQKSAAILALAEIGDPRAVRSIQSLNCESASVARLECVFAIKALTKLSKLNPETFAGEGR
jgi:HEAT repeat protein